jgi:2'-5' RNA ligase
MLSLIEIKQRRRLPLSHGGNQRSRFAKAIIATSFFSIAGCGGGLFQSMGRAPVQLSRFVLETDKIKFSPQKNYLMLVVPFEPIHVVREQLDARLGLELKHRGEAHITVLTPPELQSFGGKISMADINLIAEKSVIQTSRYQAECIGQGSKSKMKVFFVVVKSPALIEVRKKIAALFVKRGGVATAFDPDHFYPHITIGFTDQDLHEADGVIKDKSSCIADIDMI